MTAAMIAGTGSDVGKSLIVTGLARILRDRGLKVACFKAQNMSNNATAVDGGEIATAQVIQALAAGVVPQVDNNPVLLKPMQHGSELIVKGKSRGVFSAMDYQNMKKNLMPEILQSFNNLLASHDLVLVEGAGSCSELNLRANDIANLGLATAARLPVVVVGDIDRGGIFAQLIGTHSILDKADRALIKAFIVNRFRGDEKIFDGGMELIAERTGWRSLGLLPYIKAAESIPEEDSYSLTRERHKDWKASKQIKITVPLLPNLSIVDDLMPLRAEPNVEVTFVRKQALPLSDIIILPGSKSTIADYRELCQRGYDVDIKAHARRGGVVVGICGGYQILGKSVDDTIGSEGAPEISQTLGLLNVETVMRSEKMVNPLAGNIIGSNTAVKGFALHRGETTGSERPFIRLDNDEMEGAVSADGKIWGTYMHGIFANDVFRHQMLNAWGANGEISFDNLLESAIADFAKAVAARIDIEVLLDIAKSKV